MNNTKALFDCDCTDQACKEPTKQICGFCSLPDGQIEKRYKCNNPDCPNKGKAI